SGGGGRRAARGGRGRRRRTARRPARRDRNSPSPSRTSFTGLAGRRSAAAGARAGAAEVAARPVLALAAIAGGLAVTVAVAIAAEAALAEAAARAAVAVAVVARAALQHGRRAFLERLDAHGQVAQHVLVDAHLPLHLGDGGGGRIDVEEDVVPLAVLLDAVGDVAQAPMLLLGDLAAELGDQGREGIGQRIGLGGRDVLTRDEHVLVERHAGSFRMFAARRWRFPAVSRPGL